VSLFSARPDSLLDDAVESGSEDDAAIPPAFTRVYAAVVTADAVSPQLAFAATVLPGPLEDTLNGSAETPVSVPPPPMLNEAPASTSGRPAHVFKPRGTK
jgi:hypothetical protein